MPAVKPSQSLLQKRNVLGQIGNLVNLMVIYYYVLLENIVMWIFFGFLNISTRILAKWSIGHNYIR